MSSNVIITDSDIPEFLKKSKFYRESGLFDQEDGESGDEREIEIPKRFFIKTNKPKTFSQLMTLLEVYRYWMIDDVSDIYNYCIKQQPNITINNNKLNDRFCKIDYQLPFEIKLVFDIINFCEYGITDDVEYLKEYGIKKMDGFNKNNTKQFYKILLKASVYEGYLDLTKHMVCLHHNKYGMEFETKFKLYHISFEQRHKHIYMYMLNDMFNISSTDKYHTYELLSLGCFYNDLEFVKLLHEKYEKKLIRLRGHLYPDIYNSNFTDQKLELFKYLFKSGYYNYNRIFYYDENHWFGRLTSYEWSGKRSNPLTFSLIDKQTKIVEFLVKQNDFCFTKNELKKLIELDKFDTFKFILENSLDNEQFIKFLNSIVILIIKYNKLKYLKLLVESKIRPEIFSYDHQATGTAVYTIVATKEGSFDCFKYLIENKFSVNLETCLERAKRPLMHYQKDNKKDYEKIIDYIESGVPKNYNYESNMIFKFFSKILLSTVMIWGMYIAFKDVEFKKHINNAVNGTVKYLEDPKNRKDLLKAGKQTFKKLSKAKRIL